MYKVLLLPLILVAGSALASTEATHKVMGPGNFTNTSFNGLETMGPLNGSGLKASRIDVYGPASLSHGSQIGTATIMGPLMATDTTFTGPVEAHGNVQAQDSSFQGDLTTAGNEVEVKLENTQAKTITISPAQSSSTQSSSSDSIFSYFFSTKKNKTSTSEPQGARVILKGKKTLVEGPIEFIDGKGTLILEDNAQYTGRIIGGELAKKEVVEKQEESRKEG